jgi:hypothetical protein
MLNIFLSKSGQVMFDYCPNKNNDKGHTVTTFSKKGKWVNETHRKS